MPKSRRDKIVALTTTKKKHYDTKKSLVSDVQDCCEKYANVFVLEVHNERNNLLKDIRESWKHSRLFMGRNKVMAVSLGRTKESEHKPNLHKVAHSLVGKRGLLFTNEKTEEVKAWFDEHRKFCYARSGSTATKTVVLPEGALDLPHPMEPQLRQLGLPTRLKDGVIMLDNEHTVCTAGKAITTHQATILKHLGHCMAEFQVDVISHWCDGVHTQISETNTPMEDEQLDEENVPEN